MATQLIIGGNEYASEGEPLTVLYPWDQSTEVGQCHRLTPALFNTVITKAQSGFETFRKSKIVERMTILSTLANRLQKERDTLARLITLEAGKPIKLSRQEVDRAIAVCKGYAEHLNHAEERWLCVQDRKAQIKRFPYGPVLAITPFNFPLNLVIHKLAPAIACGTSFTVKPASKTPMIALFLGALAVECGYPYINVVPCDTDMTGRLIDDPTFQKISFTGSAAVGWSLAERAAHKSVSLELGSNSACIVDDLNFGEKAIAKRIAESAFQFAGQSCISLQRLYVKQSLMDKLMPLLFDASKKLRVGDPMLSTTEIGPMINLDAIYRMRSLLRQAIAEQANIALGGSTFNTLTYNPTIINRVRNDMQIVQSEVFSPILTVHPYESFEEALTLVNDSKFGIHAGIYTEDSSKMTLAFETLNVGGVLQNDTPTTRLDYLPYGGVGESGLGREGVMMGVEEMTYSKNLILRQ